MHHKLKEEKFELLSLQMLMDNMKAEIENMKALYKLFVLKLTQLRFLLKGAF